MRYGNTVNERVVRHPTGMPFLFKSLFVKQSIAQE